MNELTTKQYVEYIFQHGQREHPATMKLCYPRRIQPPHGYYNPKWYGASIYSCAQFWQRPEMDMLPHTTGALMSQAQMKMGVPTYFVRKDYAEAVAQTEPPDDFLLNQIQWPLDALLFVLPDTFVYQYFGWYVPFLSVARISAGEYPKDMPVKNDLMYVSRIGCEADRMLVHFPLYLHNTPPVDYTGAYSLKSPIGYIQSAPWADATYYEEQIHAFGPETRAMVENAQAPSPEQEQVLQRKVNSFAVKLMLALTAEPGYMESGTIQRKLKKDSKGRVVNEELWNPSLLGWKFHAVKPANSGVPTGTHASPRWHWRKGHMTLQVVGQRSALVPAATMPRFPMTEVDPQRRGKIDWDKVSPELHTAFWATHKLRWIKPVLVNASLRNDDIDESSDAVTEAGAK